MFNGIGKTRVPSINSIVGNALRIPLVLILMTSLMENGIWWAINISSIVKGSIMLIAVIFIYIRLEKIKIKKPLNVRKELITSD